MILEDYLEVHFADGTDSSRSSESYNWDQFRGLYLLVLKSQSTFFRELYNGAKPGDINLQDHLKRNDQNIRMCFDVYDVDKSGYLDYPELKTLLTEMNLHKHFGTSQAFEQFVYNVWAGFDQNMDGKLSYEEFIHIFNTILDRAG